VTIDGGSAVDGTSDAKEAMCKKFIDEHRNRRTAEAYASGWRGFARYLAREGVDESAITSADVADYLRERVEVQLVAASTVQGDRAAITCHLKHTPQSAVMNSSLITDMMNVLRNYATPSKPKLHVSVALMKEWIQHHEDDVEFQAKYAREGEAAAAASTSSVRAWRWKKDAVSAWKQERDICMMLIMMMAMLRESEATALRLENVEVKEEDVRGRRCRLLHVYIDQSKTDQVGVGAVVILSENVASPTLCPVQRFITYRTQAARMTWSSPFAFPKTGGGMMASTTPCGIVQNAVQRANERAAGPGGVVGGAARWGDKMSYGSHSLRRGGVTAARSNGVSMLAIQRHGRWKSLTVFDYVGQSIDEQLGVTAAILGRATTIEGFRVADDQVLPSADVQMLAAAERSSSSSMSVSSSASSMTPAKRKPLQRQDRAGRPRVKAVRGVRAAGASVSQSDDE